MSSAVEDDYRQEHLAGDRRLLGLILCAVIGAWVLFLVNDRLLFAGARQFWWLAWSRAAFIVPALVTWRALRSTSSAQRLDRMTTAVLLWHLVVSTYVLSTRPPGLLGPAVTSLAVSISFYAVAPLPLRLQSILALSHALASACVFAWLGPRMDAPTLAAFVFMQVILNAFGTVMSSSYATSQRGRFQAWRREAQLRTFLQQVIDTSPSMISVVDEDGRVLFVNQEAARYYGTTPEELVAKSTEDIHARADEAAGFVNDDRQVARTGAMIDKEELNTAPGGEPRWFHTVKVQLARSHGPNLVLGVSTDITERKGAEAARRKLENQMQQAQRQESLGVLSGGIAHDFNNLLSSILGNAALAAAELASASPERDALRDIETAVARGAALTAQMLAYSGQGTLAFVRLDLSAVVGDMPAILPAVTSGAELRLSLDPAYIDGDPAQARQLVMNLLTNAYEALGEKGGVITLRTGTRHVSAASLASVISNAGLQEGEHSFLEVEDTGCGVTDEALGRIFEPFYTTKFTGRGLGLAAALGIVRRHRGALQVSSVVGVGTKLVVLFPRAAGPVAG